MPTITDRIKKLESTSRAPGPAGYSQRERCFYEGHPPSMIKHFKYGYVTFRGESIIPVKGHCNSCGSESFLWTITGATQAQVDWVGEMGGDSSKEGQDAAQRLLDAGLIEYTPWPSDKNGIEELKKELLPNHLYLGDNKRA